MFTHTWFCWRLGFAGVFSVLVMHCCWRFAVAGIPGVAGASPLMLIASLLWRVSANVGFNVIDVVHAVADVHAAAGIPAVADVMHC